MLVELSELVGWEEVEVLVAVLLLLVVAFEPLVLEVNELVGDDVALLLESGLPNNTVEQPMIIDKAKKLIA